MNRCPNEWKRILYGAAIVDVIYLVIVCCFSSFSWRSAAGLLLGTLYAVANEVARGYTMQQLVDRSEAGAKRYYFFSYLIRYLAAGAVLSIGFACLDPFAVFFPMLAPKVWYYCQAFTHKKVE